MSKGFATIAATLSAAAVSAVVLLAQQPRIGNGRIVSQPVTLREAFGSAVSAQGDVAWIGYAVPVVDGERTMCCVSSGTRRINGVVISDGSACCGLCGLEPSGSRESTGSRTQQSAASGPIKLEGPDQMVVLFRIVNRQVERVRVFSDDCELDAGGRSVAWLTGVRPADSVALLESLVRAQADRRDRVTDGAISAIALHEDGAADAALDRLLAASQPQTIRAKIPFWLGTARGGRGLGVLQRIIKDDPSADVKKKAVFGISQSREPSAVDILIDNARSNSDSSVRGEAIFWLGQKAGSKAAGAITDVIERDPDTDVKKRAVFALSQLPKTEAVPLLIQVARTHSNPAVKKQAIFWLGQSKDPRALDFFAEILK
ncbi:MAG: HEAT repeat domain-containing protein [Vicinamibacterales bacterium]